MLEFARPYTPELVGWFRDFGQGAANYDANGHYARVQPIFNAFQFTDDPAGGALDADPAGAALRRRCRPATCAAAPAARSQPRGRRLGAVARPSGTLDCDPEPRCRRGRDARVARHRRRARRRRRARARRRSAPATTATRYKVRAIFDNAGFVIPGEDVKVAGVKVGSIDASRSRTTSRPPSCCASTTRATRTSAPTRRCIVRPQSLIGERFVECEPTQARAVGAEAPPPLRRSRTGRARASTCCRSSTPSKSVDLDLINNIMREPYRERLSIILNELGVGLAGRGGDLNAVIRRANPALQRGRRGPADPRRARTSSSSALAVDSDTILAPLARERRHVSGAIENATRWRRRRPSGARDLERDIERLPRFLRELRPTMARLGALADEMTPVVTDLGAAAPDIDRFVTELGPFAQAGIPALDSLGEAAQDRHAGAAGARCR